jgi:uncharacterized protein YfaP (DUF2135 family)
VSDEEQARAAFRKMVEDEQADQWVTSHSLDFFLAGWRASRAKAMKEAEKVAEQQPYYPDTHTGMRQQWVKDQIARKIRALAAKPAGDGP